MNRFKIEEHEYEIDEFGVIHQLPPFTKPVYDVEYVAQRYDSIPGLVDRMSYLRAGYVIGACKGIKSVLDVGYGNGSFLKAMRQHCGFCAGTDVSGYPIPEGCTELNWNSAISMPWDLVTFFDSLEHFERLGDVRLLRARWIAITAPSAPAASPEQLFKWKHLRPGEHLHHFDSVSCSRWMRSLGYDCIASSHIEDMIRKPEGKDPNTFTSVFQRAS